MRCILQLLLVAVLTRYVLGGGLSNPGFIEVELPKIELPKEADITVFEPLRIPLKGVKLVTEETQETMDIGGSERIINGTVVEERKEAPYSAALLEIDEKGKFYFSCTAVLVDEFVVMSAAHCAYPRSGNLAICVGTVDLSDMSSALCSRVVDKRVHSSYKAFAEMVPNKMRRDDIALLKSPISLLTGGNIPVRVCFDEPPSGILGAAYGYGFTDTLATQRDLSLRFADVGIFDGSLCFKNVENLNLKKFICTWGNYDDSEGNTCFGDSGGPVIANRGQNDPDQHVLVGINSFGFTVPDTKGTCSPRTPSAATKLADIKIKRWLRRKMYVLGGKFNEEPPPERSILRIGR